MAETIYNKTSGMIRPACADDNAVARTIWDFFNEYSKGYLKDDGSREERAYWGDVERIYITSTNRPYDPDGSSHKAGKAVDFVVKPYRLMPFFWAVLDQYYPLNLYLALPRTKADLTNNIGWGLHIHADAMNAENKLKIERVNGSLDDPIYYTTQIADWYYDDGNPSLITSCPFMLGELKRMIVNRKLPDNKRPLNESPYADTFIKQAGDAVLDAAGKAGDGLGNLAGLALIGLCALGLVKMISSGDLKSKKRKR